MHRRFRVVLTKITIGLFVMSTAAWAHGEDKPGPHGGIIQMPGAFHIELKQESRQEIAIYLLDMNWKNPTVESSRVSVSLHTLASENQPSTTRPQSKLPAVTLHCEPKKTRFLCKLPSDKPLKEGDQLEIKANRGDQSGAPVIYTYPFKASGRTHFGKH